jgi:hypothetical protein
MNKNQTLRRSATLRTKLVPFLIIKVAGHSALSKKQIPKNKDAPTLDKPIPILPPCQQRRDCWYR